MKFYRYGLVLALIAVIALSVAGCSKEPIAATVNGKNITMAELDKKVSQVAGQHDEFFKTPEGQQLKEQYKQRILDQLIDVELMIQEADKRGIKVSDKDVDAKIKELMKMYNIKDQTAFNELLKQQNMTMDEFKKELHKLLRVEKLGELVTKDKVKVTDKEIQDYFNSNKAEFAAKDRVHAAHILVQKEEDAKKILNDIKAGADFADLAKKHSIDPGSKDKGGDLSWKDKDGPNGFVPEFAEASWKLEPGQISEPVKTTYGYHIIKLIDKKPAGEVSLADVKDQIKEKLSMEKKHKAFSSWLEGTKKKASIKKNLAEPKAQPAPSTSPTAPGTKAETGTPAPSTNPNAGQ